MRAWPVACLLAVGCASAAPAAPAPVKPSASPLAAASGSPARSPSAATSIGGPRKILVIMEENHSQNQVFPSGMPYLWSLARQYGYATAWSDVNHPSLPNYLAIFGGSDFNDPQDCFPGPGCTYPGPSLFGQALARGDTARAYEESMPAPCDTEEAGNYDVNHNPWAYFPSEASQCRENDLPAGTPASGALASDVQNAALPTVGLLTPNLIHDGHNGTLAQADAWLHAWVPVLMSGPDWLAGRLAIVVVFDEGETTELVPFVIMAQGISGKIIRAPLDHYALTRLIGAIAGTSPLRHAASAASLVPVLGLSQ
jgi:phosphatidylinositol-3-phosphatase